MAVAASPRHDECVHACSLAQAMAVAARRQRRRIRTWSPATWTPARPAAAPRGPDVAALARAALAQHLEAAASRERARAMLADDHEMRLRLGELTARAAALRDRRGARSRRDESRQA